MYLVLLYLLTYSVKGIDLWSPSDIQVSDRASETAKLIDLIHKAKHFEVKSHVKIIDSKAENEDTDEDGTDASESMKQFLKKLGKMFNIDQSRIYYISNSKVLEAYNNEKNPEYHTETSDNPSYQGFKLRSYVADSKRRKKITLHQLKNARKEIRNEKRTVANLEMDYSDSSADTDTSDDTDATDEGESIKRRNIEEELDLEHAQTANKMKLNAKQDLIKPHKELMLYKENMNEKRYTNTKEEMDNHILKKLLVSKVENDDFLHKKYNNEKTNYDWHDKQDTWNKKDNSNKEDDKWGKLNNWSKKENSQNKNDDNWNNKDDNSWKKRTDSWNKEDETANKETDSRNKKNGNTNKQKESLEKRNRDNWSKKEDDDWNVMDSNKKWNQKYDDRDKRKDDWNINEAKKHKEKNSDELDDNKHISNLKRGSDRQKHNTWDSNGKDNKSNMGWGNYALFKTLKDTTSSSGSNFNRQETRKIPSADNKLFRHRSGDGSSPGRDDYNQNPKSMGRLSARTSIPYVGRRPVYD